MVNLEMEAIRQQGLEHQGHGPRHLPRRGQKLLVLIKILRSLRGNVESIVGYPARPAGDLVDLQAVGGRNPRA